MKRYAQSSRILALIIIGLLYAGCGASAPEKVSTTTPPAVRQAPKNVIIMIGDGMGFEQVKAAGMYANGAEGTLFFEQLPYKGQMTTFSANKAITDSAAAGTAMATGTKVNNGVIGMRIPGDKKEIKTVLEILKDEGKAVGLVTTADISHATPASFGAHEKSRNNYEEITQDYLRGSKPIVMLGGAQYVSPQQAAEAGYTVVEDRKSLMAVDTDKVNYLWGQFGEGHMPYEYDGVGELPHLSDMVVKALDILDNDPDGYFIMIEGGRIDHAGHANDIKRNVFETVEFANAVQKVYDWIKNDNDTLLIVTADHECGGLKVKENKGKGNIPDVSWGTGGHTGVNVPTFAWGVNAELFTGVIDNTDLLWIMQDVEDGSVDLR